MTVLHAEVLLDGEARGSVLRLEPDISFWGGIDPGSGRLIDSRHPQFGECVSGRILAMNRSIGSSSGSSILLELMRCGCGPAGIVLAEADFIVTLGAVIAREMQFGSIPVVRLGRDQIHRLAGEVYITRQGEIRCGPDG